MKKFSKKLLCLVLVLMMAMPIIVLPANAETTVELPYKLNFEGDTVLVNPKNQWASMKSYSVSDDGSSVTVRGKTTTSGDKKTKVRHGEMPLWALILLAIAIPWCLQ